MLYQPSSESIIFKRIKPSVVLAVKLRVFIHLVSFFLKYIIISYDIKRINDLIDIF
jgi:hypothetical protein